jgi:probable rRNA maturation factor
MEIFVINKQQQYKLSPAGLKNMAESLSCAVLKNIERDKPDWLNNQIIAPLEKQACLNLIIVSKAAIKKLNKQWLGKDKVTDVLAFPLIDLNLPTELDTQNGELYELGEIFIAYDVAKKQAKEYKHSLERELAFLFVHGMLHIFGFDHKNKSAEKDMFGRQKQILIQAGYPRK